MSHLFTAPVRSPKVLPLQSGNTEPSLASLQDQLHPLSGSLLII